MCIYLDMQNTAWDIVTRYITNDRHDHRNSTKKHCLNHLMTLLEVTLLVHR